MEKILTLVSNNNNIITPHRIEAIEDLIKVQTSKVWLEDNIACDISFSTKDNTDLSMHTMKQLNKLLNNFEYDWSIQNKKDRNKKIFLSDMDSTIIKQECIDEIAYYANIQEEVAKITKMAMEGQIPFIDALRKRVALLKGVKLELLNEMYHNKIEISDGAKTLLKTLKNKKIKTILVSGGFTFFSAKLSKKLGFDEHYANSLEVNDGYLTGKLIMPIIDSSFKKKILNDTVSRLALSCNNVIAVGDGANDMEMIEAAGLGVSYKGKEILKTHSNAQINYTNLKSILYFIGIPQVDFVN
ncbi:MAG: phosphoserine phosphatase SerB [Hyphomicrobiales bacterium]|nr:phosphoserine phosphatase SerB [Hyphomicrobiales bacterium]